MFPPGGWELKPGVPVLSKIVPILSKLQHTEIVVGGYTDNTPIRQQLQSAGIANNLDLSCKRAAKVVLYLVARRKSQSVVSAMLLRRHSPRWTKRHSRGTGETGPFAEGKAEDFPATPIA